MIIPVEPKFLDLMIRINVTELVLRNPLEEFVVEDSDVLKARMFWDGDRGIISPYYDVQPRGDLLKYVRAMEHPPEGLQSQFDYILSRESDCLRIVSLDTLRNEDPEPKPGSVHYPYEFNRPACTGAYWNLYKDHVRETGEEATGPMHLRTILGKIWSGLRTKDY